MEGIESKLLKPYLLINKYFDADKKAISTLEAERDSSELPKWKPWKKNTVLMKA
jgi:hypothetical protein